jgi:hypothetical protein
MPEGLSDDPPRSGIQPSVATGSGPDLGQKTAQNAFATGNGWVLHMMEHLCPGYGTVDT